MSSCSNDSVSDSDSDVESDNTVEVAELARESLHYWRVRALTSDASGIWSEPSYFRIVENSDASTNDPDTEIALIASVASRLANEDSTNATLPKTVVGASGVYENISPPLTLWRAVNSAIAYELEIVDVDTDQLKASVLINQQSVCEATDCNALLVEANAAGNERPNAIIEHVDSDPLRPELVTFTAASSSDPDGLIAAYRWRIDGRYIGIPTGISFNFEFNEQGTYRVGLEVTDNDGAIDLTFIGVQVSDDGTLTVVPEDNGEGEAAGQTDSQEAQAIAEALAEAAAAAEAEAALPSAFTTDAADSWQIRGVANRVITVGDMLIIGGDFNEIYNNDGASLPRSNLVALDRFTGEPLSFAPELDGKVWAFALSPDNETLYIGGEFHTADGLPRSRVAAFNIETGVLTDFATPSLNSSLRAIAIIEDRVYLGGLFTRIDSEFFPYLAAFDSTTGEHDTGFVASPDARVTSLVGTTGRLWIGGDFTQINSNPQSGIGAVNPANGSHQITDDVVYPVIALAASDTQLFIAGGGPGGRAAAFDLSTGIEQWEIESDGNFQAVDVESESRFVYFGGHYEIIQGDERIDRLSRHDKVTGETDFSWLPQVNGIRSINTVDVTPDGLHVGGDFFLVGGDPHEGLAIFQGNTN